MLQRIIKRLIIAEAANIARSRNNSTEILAVLAQLRSEVDQGKL